MGQVGASTQRQTPEQSEPQTADVRDIRKATPTRPQPNSGHRPDQILGSRNPGTARRRPSHSHRTDLRKAPALACNRYVAIASQRRSRAPWSREHAGGQRTKWTRRTPTEPSTDPCHCPTGPQLGASGSCCSRSHPRDRAKRLQLWLPMSHRSVASTTRLGIAELSWMRSTTAIGAWPSLPPSEAAASVPLTRAITPIKTIDLLPPIEV